MFDFEGLELTDENKKAALELLKSDETFGQYLTQATQARLDAATRESKGKIDEFRNNNIALQQKLEELSRVDTKGKDSNKDLSKLEEQFNAQLKEKQTALEQLQAALSEKEAAITESQRQTALSKAIDSYNSQSAARKVLNESGAQEILLDKIKQNSKTVDGKLILLDNNGNEFITDSGIGTVEQWISKVAVSKYPFLFNSIAGSGATGSSSGGAGIKAISRQEFDAIKDPAKRAEVARTHKIT